MKWLVVIAIAFFAGFITAVVTRPDFEWYPDYIEADANDAFMEIAIIDRNECFGNECDHTQLVSGCLVYGCDGYGCTTCMNCGRTLVAPGKWEFIAEKEQE